MEWTGPLWCGSLVALSVTGGDESTGRLLSWGMGYGEQLGHGRKDEEPVPREVAGAGVVVEIMVTMGN